VDDQQPTCLPRPLLASLFFLRKGYILLGYHSAQPAPSAAHLTRTRVQFAAETKCARYLGASDDENLWVGISWFTFLLQSSPPASPSQNETSWSVAKS
jgi:hypothetical protein